MADYIDRIKDHGREYALHDTRVEGLAEEVAAKPSAADVAAAKSRIEGTSLVIPDQPAPEPVIVIDNVPYFHKQEFDLEALYALAEGMSTENYLDLLTGEHVESKTNAVLVYGRSWRPAVSLSQSIYSNPTLYATSAPLPTYTSRAFTIVDQTPPAAGAEGKIVLPTCSAYYGYLSEDGKIFISYYNLKSDGAPEYIDSIKQGNAVIPLRAQGGSASPLTELTWTELKDLRDNGELVPGMQYRITDYTCTTTQTETRSAGHVFDIIVVADNETTLNKKARAVLHEGDTYFANSDLAAWQLWYDIDNDQTKYAWADPVNGKGVIFRMIDEWGNDCPYDFKNIQFKRYCVENDTSPYSGFTGEYVGMKDFNGTTRPAGYVIPGEEDFVWCYTFTGMDISDSLDEPEYYDMSSHPRRLPQEVIEYVESEGVGTNTEDLCKNNKIAELFYEYYGDDTYYKGRTALNNSVFVGEYYYNGTPDDWDWSVTYCYSNTLGNNCYSNTFGSDYYSNIFESDCYYNTFGSDCQSNTFGNGCQSNIFGSDCSHNTFENYCQSNTFGNGCYSNTFGNSCSHNTFGNDCYFNILGNGCGSITFGNSCSHNTFGDSCSSITFESEGRSNIFENEGYYITLQSSASGNFVQNIHVHAGVKGEQFPRLVIDVPVKDQKYSIDYYAQGSQNITI